MEEFERKYKEEKLIGKGPHSTLFLVEEVKTKKKFALKRVNKLSPKSQPSAELEILKAIKKQPHRHIIRPKEWIEDERQQLIVMEYAPKGTLKKYFKSNDLISEARVRRIFLSILEAVEHLHEKIGVAHGDLKMENILVDENEDPKLIDFNLSFFHHPDRLQTNYCGTYYYCSPEILQGVPYTGPPQDVWSLGVLLYYMLFKNYPFTSSHVEKKDKKTDIRAKVVACALSFPDIQGRKLSDDVEQLLRSIFTFIPSERPTVQQLRRHSWFTASLVDTLCVKGRSEDVFAELEWEELPEEGRGRSLWNKLSNGRSRSSSTSSSTTSSTPNLSAPLSSTVSSSNAALSSSIVVTHQRNLRSVSQTYSCVSTATFSNSTTSSGSKGNALPPTSISPSMNHALSQEEYSSDTLSIVAPPSNSFFRKLSAAFSCCRS